MTYHIGDIHQHYSDKPPCKRVMLQICKRTPRTPPRIHWLINL